MQGEWLWPCEDILTWEFFPKMKEFHGAMALQILFAFPNEIIKLLSQNKRKLIIQAGGNAGLYPNFTVQCLKK